MSNVVWRHTHVCDGCGRTWECFVPGGCREEKELPCTYCGEDADEKGEEDDE